MNSSPLEFRINASQRGELGAAVSDGGCARTGVVALERGEFATPAFMPVGTYAAVRGLSSAQVEQTGSSIVLCNTWHLSVRPGAQLVEQLGGLHSFMGWSKPILTDSGGFQVMSLAQSSKVDDGGVSFRSHLDGSPHRLTPETALATQEQLGSDIAMQLDHLVGAQAKSDDVRDAMERSLRWAVRTRDAMSPQRRAAVFGIVQGGIDPQLRRESARALSDLGFDGYAVGGLAVGEGHRAMMDTLRNLQGMLPEHRPRYLMGVGTPWDIICSVAYGIDMFDCVMPTREGRHGNIFTTTGKIRIGNAAHKSAGEPVDAHMPFGPAATVSRAYLHHLFRCGEMLGASLASAINLCFYQHLMKQIRHAIARGEYGKFMEQQRAIWDTHQDNSHQP